MVSDTPILQLWYYKKDKFNLEAKFPNAPYIEFANIIFSKCIVEDERDCIEDASELLIEIDQIIDIINRNADMIDTTHQRYCKVCGVGRYELLVDKKNEMINDFGINPQFDDHTFQIFICNNCGHVQLFSFNFDHPSNWSK